jgi:hypothetical protein
MTTNKLVATMMTLGFGMTANCASPPQKSTTRREAAPVVAALDEMCRQVRAVATDASICPHERRRALNDNGEWKRVGASQQGKEIQQAVANVPREQRYAALVALAERAGQPGWHCESLRRLGEEDPSFVHAKLDGRFVSDIDELCRIFEKNSREISDPASRAQATSQEVEQRAGCAMKEMFEALAGVEPGQRYSLMRQAAAEAGEPDWQCAFLERSWGEPNRD